MNAKLDSDASTHRPTDLEAMHLAIDASATAVDNGDGPFGATLVSADCSLVLVAANNVRTASDCTGHAEMVAVRNAQKQWAGPSCAARRFTPAASRAPCVLARCFGRASAELFLPPHRPMSFAGWVTVRPCPSTAAPRWQAHSLQFRLTDHCSMMKPVQC